ncbi:MAG: DUF6899 family protein [Candidatus Hodarchaeales archaeon]
MPYITNQERKVLDPTIKTLVQKIDELNYTRDVRDNDGRLNYCITELLMQSMECDDGPRYTKFNTAIGTLICIMLEMYRRAVSCYEDVAIHNNGDIGVFTKFKKWFTRRKS